MTSGVNGITPMSSIDISIGRVASPKLFLDRRRRNSEKLERNVKVGVGNEIFAAQSKRDP